MRRIRGWSIALVLACVLPGCSDLFTGSYRYARIQVTALDTDGEPVPGVELTLYTGLRHMGYGVTDRAGRHEFRFVPHGVYGVNTHPPETHDFLPGATSYQYVEVGEGDERDLEFVFVRAASPAESALGRGPS